MAIYKYLARKDGFVLPSVHRCGDSSQSGGSTKLTTVWSRFLTLRAKTSSCHMRNTTWKSRYVNKNSPTKTVTSVILRLHVTRAWEGAKSRKSTFLAISLKFNFQQIFLPLSRFHRNTNSYTKGCLLWYSKWHAPWWDRIVLLFMEYRSVEDSKELVYQ